ncbi:hypothetical protein BCR36DRAFT_581608 [Piromyces finnis]|uniref:Phorbol-ester/DAG-type domain-containing protein n=1 Tax=Piromyces finnis TaxID=1754191 RepID=A0A1Y1VGY5_9FUNG|nr:hypothetical protein BCR36DRAFT_581608 [Piromyces finnis]|eukprot:ORX54720.1 hypothetical protein BCR36DRAFT_581608 [Piromyces finnis]
MENTINSMELSTNHSLELTTYKSFTYCDICKKLLWGVAKQGYTCTKCGMNIHETCTDLLPSKCIPNPNVIKTHSSSSSPSNSKNSLTLNLSSTSSIIKSLQNNNLMMEATQKIQNTKSLVKEKIHQINNSNEINGIVSAQNNNSSSSSKINSNENINKVNLKENIDNENLLKINDVDNNYSTLETSEEKTIKKFQKNIIILNDKGDNSDSELLSNSNIELNEAHISREFEEDYSEMYPPNILRKRKNKDNDVDVDVDINIDNNDNNRNDSINYNNEEIKIKQNSKEVNKSEKSKEQSEKTPNTKEFNNIELIKTENNDSNDSITSSEINISVSSISKFKTSELTEIIKESTAQNNEITKLKSLKSKPSQSEISSIVVTSTSNKNSSIESSISELESINEDENNINNNKNLNNSKKSLESVEIKILKKNSASENKKEQVHKNKQSKSMAALMKTNQVHSKLEELLKNDTFSFQSKLAEVENEPLSLFSTTPKNTIVFATKIGPVFDIQDKLMDILNWKNTSLSFSVYLIYSILCFQPNLIIYIPIVSIILFLAYIYYRRETGKGKSNNRNDKEEFNHNNKKEKEKEKIKDKDLKSNLNDLLSSLSVKQKANFNPNMVDMKTLQGNIQRLQNMMGSYCSAYDSVIKIWEKLNNTDPLEIRKVLFFSLLGLLGQIILLKFIRIGIIFYIIGTFAFFPQFSIFIIWILTGWLKVALEMFNDIVIRTQNNRNNSKLHTISKKLMKSINDSSSDSESNDYPSNSQRARLYSTLENNELKVQKSIETGQSQKVMEGKIFNAIVVENQRWWVGTGFTDLLLHNDPPNYSTNYNEPKEALPSSLDNYPLPPNYRFLPDESWEIEMDNGDEEGWIYMDNIWRNEGQRKLTSYTRKRIWMRKASFYS